MPKMRLGWYAGVSTALAGSVVLSAFHQRSNFYSAMVYLSQSNFCLLVMLNFTLLLYSGFLFSLVRLHFGRLRAIEIEQLTERAWFAITETCLAMTIFREEISAWFIVMFTLLVSGKVWGWIADGRVEILEQQPPANPRLFHFRLSVSLLFGFVYNALLLRYTFNTVVQQARPNMMVMFLFEFALLGISLSRTILRYGLSLTEQNIIQRQTQKRLAERRREVKEQRERIIREREQAAAAGEEPPENQEPLPSEDDVDEMDIEVPGWSAKGELVLWLDLVIDMIRLGIYVAFFFMLLTFYGLPIHIIRDLFMTTRDFLKRLSAVLRYRKAMQEMNRHPDATAEELAENNTCIICREDMHPWNPNNPGAVERNRPKKLPCGHTLHLGCLKSWLERQQVCPTCRTPVTSDRARPAAPGNDRNRRMGLRIQIGNQPPAPAQAQPPGPANGANGANDAAPFAPPGPQAQQNHQHPPAQPQHPPAEDNDRPRIFQMGPIRVGFGRGGDQIRELGQRMGMNLPLGNNPAAAQAAPPQEPAHAAHQPPPPGDNIQTATNHLQQAEIALMNEIASLQTRQIELQTVQLLMAELQLVRRRNGLPDMNSPLVPPSGTTPAGQTPMPQLFGMSGLGLPGVPARINSPILGRHGPSNYTTSIPSGSSELPDGVVIPPGWSLMPLERYNGQPARQPSPQPGPAPPAGGPAPPESGQEATPRSAEPQTAEGESASSVNPTATPPRNNVPSGPSVISPSPVAPSWGFNGNSRLFPETASQTDSSPTRSQNNDHTPPESNEHESTSQAAAAPQTEGSSTEKGKAKAATVEDEDEDESDSEEEEDDD